MPTSKGANTDSIFLIGDHKVLEKQIGLECGCGCLLYLCCSGVRELQGNSFKKPFLLNGQEEFAISK